MSDQAPHGGLADRVGSVRSRIAAAAARAGRAPGDVRLVAATKGVEVGRIQAAVRAGLFEVGENRAQELVAKAEALATTAEGPGVRWHFLGSLQANKVARLAPWVECWQSVDRVSIGERVARHAPGARVLVEVNLAGEPRKAGCEPAHVGALTEALIGMGLEVAGLMAVPPLDGDARGWFTRLREMGRRLDLAELSMGMSDDFEIAIEEGATIVRVGRALFGDRPEHLAGPVA